MAGWSILAQFGRVGLRTPYPGPGTFPGAGANFTGASYSTSRFLNSLSWAARSRCLDVRPVRIALTYMAPPLNAPSNTETTVAAPTATSINKSRGAK